MRLPSSARIGIFATALGILVFVPAYDWVQTRTPVPVDMPVSLAPGHIRTGDFKINIEALFSIQIWFPYSREPGCRYAYDSLRTTRLTTIGTEVIRIPGNGSAIIEGPYLGEFTARPGRYSLDIEVLSDTRSLDRCRPRLVIEGTSEEFNELSSTLFFLFIFFAFCEVLGITLVGASVAAHYRTRAFDSVRLKLGAEACPLVISREGEKATRPMIGSGRDGERQPLSMGLCEGIPSYGITGLTHKRRPFRKIWLSNPREILNTVALIVVLSLISWLIPIWLIFGATQRASYGLMVSLPRQGVELNATPPGLTAPLVSVDAKRRVFLNYEETTWEKLPASLKEALRGLPVRVAYFDGDTDALYMDAAHAVDVIVGAGAKPILLTPRSKHENK